MIAADVYEKAKESCSKSNRKIAENDPGQLVATIEEEVGSAG